MEMLSINPYLLLLLVCHGELNNVFSHAQTEL